ncbi:MAG: hypothetical protein IT324_25235 [Anaerolineae bacterium]|nr:hypothetical protein [Anaerolineae bacterium]
MGYDDFDDMPGDADAEDFANFDPERYTRRRRGSDWNQPSADDAPDSASSDDFANFDPSAYVRKRRGETRQSLVGEDASADRAYRRHRRDFGTDIDDDELPDAGGVAGLGMGLLGGLLSGGRGGQGQRTAYTDILREASPLLRVGLIALGCGIVALLGTGCVVGYLLVTALTRR